MEDTPLVMTVMENENVRLSCVASGKPEPRITWRRDDNQAIHINGIASKFVYHQCTIASSYHPEDNLNENGRLNISRISRDNMGMYIVTLSQDFTDIHTGRVIHLCGHQWSATGGSKNNPTIRDL